MRGISFLLASCCSTVPVRVHNTHPDLYLTFHAKCHELVGSIIVPFSFLVSTYVCCT